MAGSQPVTARRSDLANEPDYCGTRSTDASEERFGISPLVTLDR